MYMSSPNNSTVEQSTKVLQELSDPAVQESLIALIHKLPAITEAVDQLEKSIQFVISVGKDKEAISDLTERIENKFDEWQINQETFEAIITISQKLPSIARLVTMLDQVAGFIESVVTDRESVAYLTNSIKQYMEPVSDNLDKGVSIVREAQKKAEADTSTVSVYQVYKMMKDPTVQKSLKFVNALLEVLATRK